MATITPIRRRICSRLEICCLLDPGTRLDIQVREPSVRHSMTVKQVRKSAESGPASPKETLRKRAAKEMIGE